jgi:glycosyltransferase involved in cell wall biosynthesis
MIAILCILLTIGYSVLMLAYRRGWAAQKEFVLPDGFHPYTHITVVVPARNEEERIGACLESLLAQRYPPELFEIIVVDDHSTDNTAAIVHEFEPRGVQYLRLADYIVEGAVIHSYKKKAIATAIARSRRELIVTTDADCIAPNAWLQYIAALYEQQQPVMIAAPVTFRTTSRSALQLFQQIDFMSMQGISVATQVLHLGHMSNGANLTFSRQAYNAVNGYEGIDHLATGDDYLLMTKMAQAYPDKIAYLKSINATVSTPPQQDWERFLQQRIRWASKAGKYKDNRLTMVLLLAYVFNLSFLVLAIAGLFHHGYWWLMACMFALKVTVELMFLVPVARFFDKERTLRYFIPLQPLHIVYIIIAGFLGFRGAYEWKGRRVR